MRLLATGYVLSTIISVAMLFAAWRRPRVGRWPFVVLFAGAAVFNIVTALRTPEVYVTGFAPRAFPPMREFIERVVSLAPDAIVLTIALGQLLVAVALAFGRGWVFIFGVTGAATFLAGITWLGVGAAVPLNLVLAAGVLLLLRRHAGRA